MQRNTYCYLIELQYLGFRYSGWQKQPGFKTIEGMLGKTLKFLLPNHKFKLLGAGRTDAKVSASQAYCELFLEHHKLDDLEQFRIDFNSNLPQDIKVLTIKQVSNEFNIIQHPKEKEYIYLFSHGQKNHPFCAPFMANIVAELDISAMMNAAGLFQGTHNFKSYTVRHRENAQFVRAISSCELMENTLLTANFFPKETYMLRIVGSGFIRYQIRMIMGALISLGKGEITTDTIKDSLRKDSSVNLSFVAPGSGLQLNHISFTNLEKHSL